MKLLRFFIIGSLLIFGCQSTNPVVEIKTEWGAISVELYPDKAPVSANNFLRYVKENRFDDAVFYRVVTMGNQPKDSVKIQVIQGGLFKEDHPKALPPIVHETTEQTGILHKNGVISMARWHPGTASSEFFICVGDQPELDFGGKRNPDGQGFAAFGKVVRGMDVVKKIHALNPESQYLDAPIEIQGMNINNISAENINN